MIIQNILYPTHNATKIMNAFVIRINEIPRKKEKKLPTIIYYNAIMCSRCAKRLFATFEKR